jgi:glycosyltransferase involved in cell wall biosynthesis
MAGTAWPDTSPRLKFSLLTGTLGRTVELQRLLTSLSRQTYRDFDIIIVDQNPDDRVALLLKQFESCLRVLHVRSMPGLSRARNAGLPFCNGDVVAFPDDDCWYPPNLLETVACTLTERPQVGFLTARWQDERGRDVLGRWPAHEQRVSLNHVWTRAISFTIFLRRATVERVGRFDERLGVGAGTRWGAGEETDYLLRAHAAGIRGWHAPTCIVHHPSPHHDVSFTRATRGFRYGCGTGFILKKHAAGARRIARFLLRPFAGSLLYLMLLRWDKARFHFFVFSGRCLGLLGWQ